MQKLLDYLLVLGLVNLSIGKVSALFHDII